MKRNNLLLLLLVFVFLAPGLAAYLFYSHPDWLNSGTVNRGTLLNPPQQLTPATASHKWRIMLWNPQPCQTACKQQLDRLARIRLALGRRLYEVEQDLVTRTATEELSAEDYKTLREQDITLIRLSSEQKDKLSALTDNAQIFIVNPENYLILSYAVNAQSSDIFHDIKHLLRQNA